MIAEGSWYLADVKLSGFHSQRIASLRSRHTDALWYNKTVCWWITLYIYIYIVLFGPVEPKLGVIPSGQENHSGAEHLNFPGRELNVIDFTEKYFLK